MFGKTYLFYEKHTTFRPASSLKDGRLKPCFHSIHWHGTNKTRTKFLAGLCQWIECSVNEAEDSFFYEHPTRAIYAS